MKKIILFLFFIYFAFITNGQVIHELHKLLPSDGEAQEYFSDGVAIDGNLAAISAPWDDNINGTNAGAVYIFEFDGSNWIEKAKIIASNGDTSNRLGKAIDLQGNRLIASSIYSVGSNFYGRVYIFEYNGTNWMEQAEIFASDSSHADYYGNSVAINGNYAVVGSTNNDLMAPQAGSAYIYKFDGSQWNLQSQLVASDGADTDYFGREVDIDSLNVIVAADFDDNINGVNAGCIYHFERSGTVWTEKSKIIPSDGQASDYFGKQIDFDGVHMIVSSSYDDDNGPESGSVYFFEYNGTNWIEKSKISSPNPVAGELFGNSAALHGKKAVVTSYYNDNENGVDAGVAYTYELNGNTWTLTSKLIPSDGNDSLYFGSKSAIYGNKILVGCLWDNDNGIKSGSAYMFSIPKVKGIIFHDFDEDCNNDVIDVLLPQRLVKIDPINIIVQSGEYGSWFIDSLPIGTYTITYDTSGNWFANCSPVQTLVISNSDSLVPIQKFGLVSSIPCFSPEISTVMPAIRPCFTEQPLLIRVQNKINATGNLLNGYVDLMIDSMIIPTSSDWPYTSLGNHQYRFQLPDTLFPGDKFDIRMECTVDCNAILESTTCIKVQLFPQDTCVLDTISADIPSDFTPCTLPWDRSNIFVDGWCDNDTIYFLIANTGVPVNGDMDCFSPVRLFIDGVLSSLDSIQLLGGAVDTLVIPGDGRTWRLEVDQHPLHPGNSHPNATVELCGDNSNWTSDLVNILPSDDADPIIDIYCGLITASYDPNDKTGLPLGVTDTHFIARNGILEYLIRFQNTGSDTAFTVVIRDTLDVDFDIFSVVSGVASHSYEFKMFGPRVLEWKFSNILLPDSTTDEEGSHGFIAFSVKQNPYLTNGTELSNTADIYFDYNAPIITNTTSHVIKVQGFQVNSIVEENENFLDWLIYPNPGNGIFHVVSVCEGLMDYQVADISGKIISSGTFEKKENTIDLSNKANGIYLLRIGEKTLKIIKL